MMKLDDFAINLIKSYCNGKLSDENVAGMISSMPIDKFMRFRQYCRSVNFKNESYNKYRDIVNGMCDKRFDDEGKHMKKRMSVGEYEAILDANLNLAENVVRLIDKVERQDAEIKDLKETISKVKNSGKINDSDMRNIYRKIAKQVGDVEDCIMAKTYREIEASEAMLKRHANGLVTTAIVNINKRIDEVIETVFKIKF